MAAARPSLIATIPIAEGGYVGYLGDYSSLGFKVEDMDSDFIQHIEEAFLSVCMDASMRTEEGCAAWTKKIDRNYLNLKVTVQSVLMSGDSKKTQIKFTSFKDNKVWRFTDSFRLRFSYYPAFNANTQGVSITIMHGVATPVLPQ